METRKLKFWKKVVGILAVISYGVSLHSEVTQGLQVSEYGAFALVCKRELDAVGKQALQPICVHVPPAKKPPRSLLRFLQEAGIAVADSTACYPHGQLPTGTEIRIWAIQRGQDSHIAIKVETGNLALEPNTHVASLLRRGTYNLAKNERNEWVVESYKLEKDS